MKRSRRSVLLSLLAALSMVCGACTTTLGVKYTHDSSIPDYHDWNESNMAGPFVRFYACPNYIRQEVCTEVELSAEWEFHTPGPNHTFGTNPVGQVEIRQPIWTWKHD